MKDDLKIRIILIIVLGSIIIYYYYKRRETFENEDISDSNSKVEIPIKNELENSNWIKEYIDKVYVIALPKRKTHVLKTLDNVGIEPEVYDAYLKANVFNDKDKLINSGFLAQDFTVSDARIACHYSHIQVLKKFLEDPVAKTCLIFEDDLRTPYTKNELKVIFKSIMNTSSSIPWDVINLGRCWDSCANIEYRTGILVKSPYAKCRHAYIVSRKGAQIMIDDTQPMKHSPGDEMIAKINLAGGIEYLATRNNIFLQNREVFGSNLGNNNFNSSGGPPTCRKMSSKISKSHLLR